MVGKAGVFGWFSIDFNGFRRCFHGVRCLSAGFLMVFHDLYGFLMLCAAGHLCPAGHAAEAALGRLDQAGFRQPNM